ncbi:MULTISPECIES: peptide deformylase [unclassified Actinoplanes]|uniref:peptide deformylase n=1 Tax=unclassified Actinoplanes TaxID=2626549 RepID=UPI00031E5928|nr:MULTISPECIES: peptide deformylase [unclassified Actinoplanes]SLL99665.1 Peptide deformylase [Actinoplanes sp. SE50/110]
MTVVDIRKVGDPVLRRVAEPVTDFDAELDRLVRDLTETLLRSHGAGLAAPQIGVSLRVFAINPDLPGNDLRLDHLVNPVLEFPDDEEQDGPEGCLSIPGIYLDTRRRMNVSARGFTKQGDPVQVVGDGILARCMQHETDHLDGILFLDRQDEAGRQRLLATLREAAWFEGLAAPEVRVSPH